MITKLDITGFKSVRELQLDCRRINLFIGEPNTGKSNILEALGFLSWSAYGSSLKDYVRLEKTQDLFYDGLVDKAKWKIIVTVSEESLLSAALSKKEKEAQLASGCSNLAIRAGYKDGGYDFWREHEKAFVRLDHNANFVAEGLKPLGKLSFVKFYRFKTLQSQSSQLGSLLPPDGRNIVALIYSSKELRLLAGEYFAPSGLKLVITPHENKLNILKDSEGIAVNIPYNLTSDTLQRMIFYTTAIESSKDSTLIFEEPEAHAFPYFTKHLGERIALDENKNQYFIATHNPYLLSAIWEKSSPDDVAVFATYYRNYETRIKLLTTDDVTRLFEADPFLGIAQFVES